METGVDQETRAAGVCPPLTNEISPNARCIKIKTKLMPAWIKMKGVRAGHVAVCLRGYFHFSIGTYDFHFILILNINLVKRWEILPLYFSCSQTVELKLEGF
jgi:hypothetical protein